MSCRVASKAENLKKEQPLLSHYWAITEPTIINSTRINKDKTEGKEKFDAISHPCVHRRAKPQSAGLPSNFPSSNSCK